jgi:hypothetical protein
MTTPAYVREPAVRHTVSEYGQFESPRNDKLTVAAGIEPARLEMNEDLAHWFSVRTAYLNRNIGAAKSVRTRGP